MGAERSRIAEVQLKSELDAALKSSAQLKGELAVARSSSPSSSSSSSSSGDISSHPDFVRAQQQLDAARAEIERRRSVEQSLREQLAAALAQVPARED